jgi:hypothetical protein
VPLTTNTIIDKWPTLGFYFKQNYLRKRWRALEWEQGGLMNLLDNSLFSHFLSFHLLIHFAPFIRLLILDFVESIAASNLNSTTNQLCPFSYGIHCFPLHSCIA